MVKVRKGKKILKLFVVPKDVETSIKGTTTNTERFISSGVLSSVTVVSSVQPPRPQQILFQEVHGKTWW